MIPSLDPFSMPWTRHQGSTPSSGTGPSSAFDGNWYLYADATLWNTSFILELLPPVGGATVLEFWYHMHGSSTGSLAVELLSASEYLAAAGVAMSESSEGSSSGSWAIANDETADDSFSGSWTSDL
eukprot:COSAG04_NODE_17641_length_463_cov_1.233516_1_plen_125_part_10